jgi:hypothetical protein
VLALNFISDAWMYITNSQYFIHFTYVHVHISYNTHIYTYTTYIYVCRGEVSLIAAKVLRYLCQIASNSSEEITEIDFIPEYKLR